MGWIVRSVIGGLGSLAVMLGAARAAVAGTTFTYQGRLDAGPNPVYGVYDFAFTNFDAPMGGTQAGPGIVTAGVPITNGLFVVDLDFGNVFDSSERWLEIAVRTNGNASFTVLNPRQRVSAAPYAITAQNLSGGPAGFKLSDALTNNDSRNVAFGGTLAASKFSGDGSAITNLNAIARIQGVGTNTVLMTTNGLAVSVTNDPLTTTNMLLDFAIKQGRLAINVSQNPGDALYGQLFVNTTHNGTPGAPHNTEWQWNTPSHIAIGPGFNNPVGGHLQLGIGNSIDTNKSMWAYFQNQPPLAPTDGNPLGWSGALAFWNGVYVGAEAKGSMPGIFAHYVSTNGPAGEDELVITPELGNGSHDDLNFSDSTAPGVAAYTNAILIRSGNSNGIFMGKTWIGSLTTSNSVRFDSPNVVYFGNSGGEAATFDFHSAAPAAFFSFGGNGTGHDAQLLVQDGQGSGAAHTYSVIGSQSVGGNVFCKGGLTVGSFTPAGDNMLRVDKGVSNDGGGLKHVRVTTGSVAASGTALVTVTWGTAFADSNYTVTASVLDSAGAGSGLSMVRLESVSAATCTVRVQNTSATSRAGTLHVIAMHD